MNSVILSSLASFFKTLAEWFKKSAVYALLMCIYNAVLSSWNGSAIMNWLHGSKTEGAGEGSITKRVVFSPFAFLNALKNKAGDFFEKNISRSFICTWAKTYIQNFMAVNTRFFGIMLISMALGYCVMGRHISKIALIVGAVGAILCIFNYNLMSFLNPSKFVGIIKSMAGFKNLDFEFFNEEETHGVLRLLLALAAGIITGAAMSVNILYGAVIPFAVFGLVLVMYAPVTGVYAAVFLAPFVPTMILAGLCIWTTLSLIIKSIKERDFKWRFDGVGICIILFLLVLLVSSFTSFARGDSLKVWAMYFVFVMFYFTVINSVETKEQLYGLFKLLVISGALVALYGIMQYLFGWTTSNAWIDEEMFEDSVMRVYSTLGNPNVLGEYLLLVLPVAAVFMLKEKWRGLSKWTYGLMFLVLALCLILTQSRGCWIGFMLSVVIFVTFYEGKWWGIVPIVICILPFIVPQTIVDRIMSVGNMEDSSTSYRVYIWMGTLGMMKHYWLGGIGMGEAAFSHVYPFFSYNAIIAPHSHNLFLQLLVEAGIGGLGIFLVTQGVFLKKMSVVYRSEDKKQLNSMLSLAIASGVMGFLIQSMFDYTFYNYRVMAIFFMLMALGMSLKHITGNVKNQQCI
ncbi:MAG: O-antigen ligase family protein [Oscillospiraceae bacterium]|nr:O-antigen ligase family protein [Oscillospiraceae bacterium]